MAPGRAHVEHRFCRSSGLVPLYLVLQLALLIPGTTGYNGFVDMSAIPELANFTSTTSNVSSDVVQSLIGRLLGDYDARVRPRDNQSHAVDVHVLFEPFSVVGLEMTSQKLDVLGAFGVTWKDELLHWDPVSWHGLDSVKLPLSQVWRPQLVLQKALDGNGAIGDASSDVVDVITFPEVPYATVVWVPEGIYSVVCDLDVTYYPFDVQECDLTFYVVDQTLNNVNLTSPPEVSLARYTENAEWRLLSVGATTEVKFNANMVSIKFVLERRAQFTLFTVALPLLMLSILGVVGLLTPVDCGEKISYMVTLFLTFCFFVFTMRDGLPHNSLKVSHFLVYLLEMSIISVVSVLYTIAQARVFQTHGSQPVRVCQAGAEVSVSARSTPVRGAKKKSTAASHGGMTWAELFIKLDQGLAVLLTILVTIFTSVFYGSVLNR